MSVVLNLKPMAIQGVVGGLQQSMNPLRMYAKVVHVRMCVFLGGKYPKYSSSLKGHEMQKCEKILVHSELIKILGSLNTKLSDQKRSSKNKAFEYFFPSRSTWDNATTQEVAVNTH